MAGLAALMTRKKRDRRREMELKNHMQGESFEGVKYSITKELHYHIPYNNKTEQVN